MDNKENPRPLTCECGGSKFTSRGGGRWECASCGTTSKKKFVWVDQPKESYRDLDELLEDRIKEEKRTFEADKVNKDLNVNFHHSEPIAIIAFGDPHLDDKGTMMSRVIEDLEYVKKNENVYGVCVGDITNNWVGRLQVKFGEQSTGIAESWMLIEWFCEEIPWLAMVLGNHDKWNDGLSLLKKLTKGKMVQADECSFKLVFSNKQEITVNARHKWRGNSQWNPAHGISKHAQFGNDYDIILGGHTHVSAYAQVLGARKRQLSHCIQLASYKALDSYARTEGFKEHNISPSMCLVIDPNAKREEDKVTCTYSIAKGLALHKAILEDYRKNTITDTRTKKSTKRVAKKSTRRVSKKSTKGAAEKTTNKVSSKRAPRKSRN